MAYTRHNMMYEYDWTGSASHDINNFNRTSGHEVLFIINTFLKKNRLTSVGSGNKAEGLIKEKLSSKNYSQKEVIAFLSKYWSKKKKPSPQHATVKL